MAIPDFSQGAMENWGLVLYRESFLLYKDGISTALDKNTIAIVISHELVHQWFGNNYQEYEMIVNRNVIRYEIVRINEPNDDYLSYRQFSHSKMVDRPLVK